MGQLFGSIVAISYLKTESGLIAAEHVFPESDMAFGGSSSSDQTAWFHLQHYGGWRTRTPVL
jgi:hypothetical protein